MDGMTMSLWKRWGDFLTTIGTVTANLQSKMNNIVNLLYVRCVNGRVVKVLFSRNVITSSVGCFCY